MSTKTRDDLLLPGKKLMQENKFEQALRFFGELAAKNPDDPVIYLHIGLAALRLGRYESALANFTRGEEMLKRIDWSPDEKTGWEITFAFNRALCYHRLELYKKSSEILMILVEKNLFASA